MEYINKIEKTMRVEVGKPQKKYQVTVTDLVTGEVMYQWHSYSGVACNVEEVTKFGADMEGRHQIVGWGHPMAQFYALDQLKGWFRENGDAFVDTLVANGVVKGDVEFLKEMFRKN